MKHDELRIAVGTDSVGAQLDRPAKGERRSAILLAHGSGVDIEHPWMSTMAGALVERGFAVMRFRYPYMERAHAEGKPRPPDRAPVLEETHAAARCLPVDRSVHVQ